MFELKTAYENTDDSGAVSDFARAELATCKWVGELLQRTYPGHPWFVEVKGSPTGAVIMIQLRGIMPPDRWYVVKFADVLTDPGGKRTVLRGAGELLERYQIPRTGFSIDEWRQALLRFPIGDGRGHLEPLR